MEKRPSHIKIEAENRGSPAVLPVFAFIALGLFLTLCWYAYNYYIDNQKGDGVYYIKADKSPFKVQPENPGGMQVENQDKQIFNAMVGSAEKLDGQINVVEGEEGVEDKVSVTASVAEDAEAKIELPGSNPDNSVTKAISKGEKDSNKVIETAKETKKEIDQKAQKLLAETAKSADEIKKIQEQAKKAVAEATGDKKVADHVKVVEQNAQKQVEKSAKIKQEQAKADVSEKAEQVAAKKAETKAAPKNIAKVVSKVDEKTGASTTTVSLKTPKSMSNIATSAKGGAASAGAKGFYVQISSHRTMSELEGAWKKFSGKFSSVSSGASKNVSEADVKGVKYYRLSFGPYTSRSAAAEKCQSLKAQKQDCLVMGY